MFMHPEIARLRTDDAPQRAAQAVMTDASEAWRAGEQVILDALTRFDRGADLAELPPLAELFSPGGTKARSFVQRFVAIQAAALGREPLGHLAHRHFTDGTNSTLLLGRAGGTTLTLVAIDGEALAGKPAPTAVTCTPIDAWDCVLAGSAAAEMITCTPDGPRSAQIDVAPIDLAPGVVVARNARTTALLWRKVHGRLVVLSLQRRGRTPEPVREFALADGRQIHAAAGSPRDSRFEIMVSLLGAMGREDAAPLLAAIGREPGADALRWQALREGLGLDTRIGFEALDTVARDSADPLSTPAAALRAHLLETYPQLRELA